MKDLNSSTRETVRIWRSATQIQESRPIVKLLSYRIRLEVKRKTLRDQDRHLNQKYSIVKLSDPSSPISSYPLLYLKYLGMNDPERLNKKPSERQYTEPFQIF